MRASFKRRAGSVPDVGATQLSPVSHGEAGVLSAGPGPRAPAVLGLVPAAVDVAGARDQARLGRDGHAHLGPHLGGLDVPGRAVERVHVAGDGDHEAQGSLAPEGNLRELLRVAQMGLFRPGE